MVVLHGLRDIDDIDFILPIKHIVFTQVCVDQSAFLIQDSRLLDNFQVDFWKLLNISFYIFQLRGGLHVFSNEVHDEDIGLDREADRRWYDTFDSLEISEFLFSPFGDHLSGVRGTVSPSEPKLSTDVSVSVLKY